MFISTQKLIFVEFTKTIEEATGLTGVTPATYSYTLLKNEKMSAYDKYIVEQELPIYLYELLHQYGICSDCLGEGYFHHPYHGKVISSKCCCCQGSGKVDEHYRPDANFKFIEEQREVKDPNRNSCDPLE